MNIREFSYNLQKLYAEMAQTFSDFQSSSGLPCLEGCGKCCLNPEIEASPLEMIPLALKIYDEGKLEEWMDKLEGREEDSCLVYTEGKCGSYHERPAVCRMFGVAGYFDKHHKATLSICKYIRESNPEQAQRSLAGQALVAPMMAEWFAKLNSVDPNLTQDQKPLNEALKIALIKIALHENYLRCSAPEY
jgi:Fe-S-cluster containining protein